ncbi:MAG: ABC transporter permease [Oscillospiraceae bacterium]|nr:ABC transporter permease [Oscillospiraceae bacterium]
MKTLKAGILDRFLGLLWLIIEPLSQMAIYYFILVVIFRAGPKYGTNPFVFLMLGLSHFLHIQRSLSAGAGSILSNQSLLMQIRFEPLILNISTNVASILEFLISLAVYSIFFFIYGPGINPNIEYYPLILGAILIVAYNLSLLASAVTVVLRDFQNLSGIAIRVLMYASPIIYSIDFVPKNILNYYMLNPFACLFALLQWSVLNGPLPETKYIYMLVTFIVLLTFFCHWTYAKLRPTFTKVL